MARAHLTILVNSVRCHCSIEFLTCCTNERFIADPVLSCSAGAQPNLTDSCCSETYGGLLVSGETIAGMMSAC